MILNALKLALTTALPNLIQKAVDYITTEEEPIKVDRTKFTEAQTQEIVNMWKAWKEHPEMYLNQEEFATNVNLRFNTEKATSTIVKHVKKYL